MLVIVFSWLLGGLGAVLRVFWITLLFSDQKNSQNGSKTSQKPRKDDNEQLKYDLPVLFSLKFIFNPEEWVTCGSEWTLRSVSNDEFVSSNFSIF